MEDVLRKHIRGADSAARIGSDELAIVLSETTSDKAAVLAKRIRTDLGSASAGLRAITVSIGSSCLGPNISSWQVLLAEADRAMYKAKRMAKKGASMLETPYLHDQFQTSHNPT